eukprot:Gb_23459 [translate_table: standard]
MRVPLSHRVPLRAYFKYVKNELNLWIPGASAPLCESKLFYQWQSQKGSTSVAIVKTEGNDILGQAFRLQSLSWNLSTRFVDMGRGELIEKGNRPQVDNQWTAITNILLDMHMKFTVTERAQSTFDSTVNEEKDCQQKGEILADVQQVCSILEQGSFCNVEDMLGLVLVKVTPDLVCQVLEKSLKFEKAVVKTALRFFDWAARQPGYKHTSNAFGMMVEILAQRTDFDAMWIVIENMRKEGCLLTSKTVAIVIASLGKAGLVESAARVFNQMETLGCKRDTAAYNAIICVYSKAGRIKIVQDLYAQMLSAGCPSDTATHNILIDGFCRVGELSRAQEVFHNMLEHGCVPDVYTYNTFLDNLLRADDRDGALKLLEDMEIRGCAPNSVSFTCVVHRLCKANQLIEAWKLWKEMVKLGSSCTPTCNVLLQAFCKACLVDDACLFLIDMRKHEMACNLITYNIVLHSLCRAKRMYEAECLFSMMLDDGCNPDVATYTSMINGFCQAGMLLDAYNLWISMAIKHLDTYTVLIHGLCKAGEVKEASNLIEEMIENNVFPDLHTFEMVALALNKAGRPDMVIKLHTKTNEYLRIDINVQEHGQIFWFLQTLPSSEPNLNEAAQGKMIMSCLLACTQGQAEMEGLNTLQNHEQQTEAQLKVLQTPLEEVISKTVHRP